MLTDTQKKLVEENIRLIQWIAARWRNPNLEPDDVFQIAAVGFCKAARDYDSSKGKFSVFALQYAINELLSASGRRKNVKVYSLDLPIKCGDGNLTIGMALRADSNLDADIVAGQVMELVRAASTAERRILTLMSYGYKQYEAAKLLGMSRQNVQQTIKRVKPKFDKVTGIF